MNLIVIVILLILWYFIGKNKEKKHYESIREREKKYEDIFILNEMDLAKLSVDKSGLLTGSVVVAIDYFKKFVSWLINIFWGRLFVYETLIDRARREAILKVKEKAYKLWANAIVNLRIETSSISQNSNKSVWAVEVLAYGTAVQVDRNSMIDAWIVTNNVGYVNTTGAENYNLEKGSHLGKWAKFLIYLLWLLAIIYIIFLQIANIVVTTVSLEKEKQMFSEMLAFDSINEPLTEQVRNLVWDVSYNVYVVNEAEPNAFASLGANMYITTSFLDMIDTENELLFVIWHEMAHIENRDVLRRVATQIPFSVALNLIVGNASDVQGVWNIVSYSYDKHIENVSDEYGLSFLNYRMWHVGCAIEFFEKMNSLSSNAMEIMSDHPTTISRIANMKSIIEREGYEVEECSPLNLK